MPSLFKSHNDRMIQEAGARFTPNNDADAPNLKIESLYSAVQGLLRTDAAFANIENLASSHDDKWSNVESLLHSKITARDHQPGQISAILRSIDRNEIGAATNAAKAIKMPLKVALTANRNMNGIIHNKISKTKNNDDNLQRKRRDLNQYYDINQEVGEHLESPEYRLLDSNLLLVTGEWGTGKTHTFCDLTRHLTEQGHIVNFSLAKNFTGENPLEDIAQSSGIESFATLCETANRAAVLGQRAVIIIDGINEGNRTFWSNAVLNIVTIAQRFPFVGFILTYRTPFQEIIIKKHVLKKFVLVNHHGFSEEQTYDAQKTFFKFYEVPLPEVPLLAEEFARPLTLKLICQTIASFSARKRKNWMAGISNGQIGMTAILEDFIVHTGRAAEQELGLVGKFCWGLIKGDKRIADPDLQGLAPLMARTELEYVSLDACKNIIRAHLGAARTHLDETLYGLLTANGVLVEDVIRSYEEGRESSSVVVRLPYQRFSDHIIARYLLTEYPLCPYRS